MLYNVVSGSFVLLPVFGHTASSLRVDMLEVTELVFDQQDIQDKKVVPDALIKYLGIFMEWTTQAINF